MFKQITWPVAFIATVALLVVSSVFVGIPIWLIARGSAKPELLAGPISAVLVALGALAVHAAQKKAAEYQAQAAYVKGQSELPAYLTDPTVHAVMKSLPPPPTAEELGGVTIPVTTEAKS